MNCRPGCGACCVAISIRDMPGMPAGKPAGVPCVHLAADLRCGLWGRPERPACCDALMPEPAICGTNREEAFALLTALEEATRP